MTARSTHARKWLALALLALTQFVDRPRRLDRERRAALDRPRARLHPGQPVLGRQRLHADLRRLPAARRPPGRPARPPAAVHGRPGPLRRSPRSLGGLAQSDVWLIAARAVQGLGAALISPAALSLVTTMFTEGAERNKALGVWGAVAGSGGAAGVLLGGMLTAVGRLGVGAVRQRADRPGGRRARAAPAAREPRRRARPRRSTSPAPSRSPPASRCSSTRSSTPTTPAGPRRRRSASARSRSSLLAAFVADRAAHAATRSCRSTSSACRRCAAPTSSACSIGMSLFSMFFFISLYLQQVLGYDALKAGFAYLPLALTIIVSAGVASQLVTRVGFKPTLIGGLLLIAAGAAVVLARLAPGGTYLGDVLFPSLLAAIGPRVRVRPGHDRRGHGHAARRGRAGLRAHQHRPAGRRGARPGDPRRDRQQPRRPTRSRPACQHRAVALTEGFQTAFLVGAGFAAARRGAGRRADLLARQPRARRGRAARRGDGRRRGLALSRRSARRRGRARRPSAGSP